MITIGSDVEVAVHRQGVPVDVAGLIGGDKNSPVWYDNFNLQEDNVNAEYAINPVSSLSDWVAYHTEAIEQVEHLLPKGYGILYDATTEYSDDALASDNSKVFGCDPDLSAWNGMPNRTPSMSKAGNMRTCGGHIHVGVEGVDKRDLVKWMDVLLGMPSLFMDDDRKRRTLYGKAGSYRDKPYGVEYRALSNFWIKSHDGLEWAYNQTLRAVEYSMTDMLDHVPNITNIPRSIDKYDMRVAETTLNWLTKEGYV